MKLWQWNQVIRFRNCEDISVRKCKTEGFVKFLDFVFISPAPYVPSIIVSLSACPKAGMTGRLYMVLRVLDSFKVIRIKVRSSEMNIYYGLMLLYLI